MIPAVLKDTLLFGIGDKEKCVKREPIEMVSSIHPELPVQIIKIPPSESADHGVCGQ